MRKLQRWLKGGIIGAIFCLAVFLFWLFAARTCINDVPCSIHYLLFLFPTIWMSVIFNMEDYPRYMLVFDLMFYFVIGVIISLLLEKKGKKQEQKEDIIRLNRGLKAIKKEIKKNY